jgi:hypothetical protein
VKVRGWVGLGWVGLVVVVVLGRCRCNVVLGGYGGGGGSGW